MALLAVERLQALRCAWVLQHTPSAYPDATQHLLTETSLVLERKLCLVPLQKENARS